MLFNSWFGYALRTGVGFYVDQLARHLRALAEPVDVRVFRAPFAGPVTRVLDGSRGLRNGGRRYPDTAAGLTAGSWLRTAWSATRELYFRCVCGWHQVDLYHEPNHIPLRFDGPIVTTVHDVSALLRPQFHPIDRVRYFESHFCNRLRWTTRYITDSEFTRRELVEHLGVNDRLIHVVPLAARAEFRPMQPFEYVPHLKRLRLPPRYLLFVGTIEPRKNLLGLLRAYEMLPVAIKAQYPLVLAGRWGWRSQEVTRELARIEPYVHKVGYVADADLPAVFNGAAALAYPSLYEGFGLPPLEMMACGRPVIVSKATSLPEVVGPDGQYVNPEDPANIAAAIRRVLGDPGFAAELARRGLERSRQFSWQRTAAATLGVYRDAIAAHRGAGSQPPAARAA